MFFLWFAWTGSQLRAAAALTMMTSNLSPYGPTFHELGPHSSVAPNENIHVSKDIKYI
jgi:hypothetical protein